MLNSPGPSPPGSHVEFIYKMVDDDVDMDEALSEFLCWCDASGLVLSKRVKVGVRGSFHRYGMTAADDIKEGECLFEIPRSLLLQPKTSSISEILASSTDEEQFSSEKGSGWAPLLLALMYEYTNPTSRWKPYLNLVPDVTILDQPMFWGEDERQKELRGTGIEEDVESDIQHIEEEYNSIVLPFIKKHQQYFSESCHTLDLYKHMAAFVMAYSFTEKTSSNNANDGDDDDDDDDDDDGTATPVMVPMADILNHISNNNARLEFGTDSLAMVAVQDISKGQEIFNTYGKLANCHLLQSYGFVEDDLPNPYDMVDIPVTAFHEVLKANQPSKPTKMLNAKFEFMEEMGVASEDDMFLFGRDGCSHHGPDLYATLRILHMTDGQFKQLLEEQIKKQRSKTFDDIARVLDQQDEKTKRNTSRRILELVSKAEKEGKKRGTDEENTEGKHKKLKIVDECVKEGADDKESGVSESNSSNDENTSRLKTSSGTFASSSKNNVKLSAVEAGSNALVEEYVKQGFIKERDERCDKERTENAGKVSDTSDCDSNDEKVVDDDDDDHSDNDDDDSEYDDEERGEDTENNAEEEENEESEQTLTYDLLSQCPLEWRKTLKSVAELCVKRRYGVDKLDQDSREDNKLSKRQLFALRIRRGQKSIFQRICELVDENSVPEEQ